MATSAVALLTVRTWREEGTSSPWRFEIRMTKDVALGFQPVWTVSTRAKEMDAVIAFLDDAALWN
jgi:hypothetical protein